MPVEVAVTNGQLVRMKKDGEIRMFSISCVGHKLAEGWRALDVSSKPIKPTKVLVLRRSDKLEYIKAIDPGPQYNCCFEVGVPGHLATATKASKHKQAA